jgi:hypothetical protein
MLAQLLLLAFASAVPSFDLDKICHAGVSKGNEKADYELCEASEKGALEKLRGKWSQYPAKERDDCAHAIGEAPGGSYVELLTCIELQHSDAPK